MGFRSECLENSSKRLKIPFFSSSTHNFSMGKLAAVLASVSVAGVYTLILTLCHRTQYQRIIFESCFKFRTDNMLLISEL